MAGRYEGEEADRKELPEHLRKRSIVLVGGKTGLGKSYLVKHQLIPQYPRIIIADPMLEYDQALYFDDSGALAEHCMKARIYRVRCDNVAAFPDLCYIANEVGQCCLVVEESQRYLPSRSVMDENFEDLVFRGRHRAVSLLLVMQRFSTVHINVRSQWTEIISFRQTETADTSWLRDTSGFDLPELESLEPGLYYHITPKGAEIKGAKFKI